MKTNRTTLNVFVDAAVHPHATGLGVVLKSEAGEVIGWHKDCRQPMTCNEAEYEALIFALRTVKQYATRFRQAFVKIHSDSRVVVEQMTGAISVRNDRLRMLHRIAQSEARDLKRLDFIHIPRRRNELADALAEDAVANATSKAKSAE